MKFAKHGHLGGYIYADETHPKGDEATWCPEVWEYLIKQFPVREVIDVGCGEGHALEWFLERGLDAWGIDGVAEAKAAFAARRPEYAHKFVVHDYTKKHYSISLDADLVWCCEFVEHVSKTHMLNFLHTFTHAKVVAMTHAFPGQAGHHHVNCERPEWWIDLMRKINFTLDPAATDTSRKLAAPDSHWARSGLVFLRGHAT
jgi:SAM-dependent methyltransferase